MVVSGRCVIGELGQWLVGEWDVGEWVCTARTGRRVQTNDFCAAIFYPSQPLVLFNFGLHDIERDRSDPSAACSHL